MTRRFSGLLRRVLSLALSLAVLFSSPAQARFVAFADPEGGYDVAVIEHLKVKVPEAARQAWLEAERGSWEPWLARQQGFLGRDLLWNPETEEGTLLIRWRSREAWKAIPEQEVDAVQQRFEQLAREATGERLGNPFPLLYEGELLPQ
ncbi:antibiotic biosynthesis monooxygenase-like domain containing protein [Synechococcus sp. WH 8101]|nr:antibiotic biosynthesis monooxygenase-like domain containing protein [Synechococcus sp. WH 8101]